MRKNAKGYRRVEEPSDLQLSLTLSEGGKEGKCWETPGQGKFGKVIGGQGWLWKESVVSKQAYLSLPALFRHCWGQPMGSRGLGAHR